MTCLAIKISVPQVSNGGQVNYEIGLIILGDDVKTRLGCTTIIHMVPAIFIRLGPAMNHIIAGSTGYVIVAGGTCDCVVA